MARKFDPLKKKKARVLGSDMAYVEHGAGDPIVLLHGNPTSSFLWRDVIPELAGRGRCIAPDLVGMGDSAQIASGPNAYRFGMHAEYLEAFLEVLEVNTNVTLVAHDWGGPLAFDWGRKNPGAIRGVAFMETIVTPLLWSDWPEPSRRIFEAMRSDAGEEIILIKNVFVERIAPASVMDPMPEEVLEVYRRPYREAGESRRPTLTWPRELPLDGEPAHMVDVVSMNEEWLSGPDVTKLFVNADPGFVMGDRIVDVVRSWPNLSEVTVRGFHFIQEDSGPEIGKAIADWMDTL